jgi:hypothetical protein
MDSDATITPIIANKERCSLGAIKIAHSTNPNEAIPITVDSIERFIKFLIYVKFRALYAKI